MIFSKNFDASLWLILEGDKKNRERIGECIKDIPEEVYRQIHLALDKYDEYEKNEVDIFERGEDGCLSGVIIIYNSCKYSFVVDMILGTLTITKNIINGDEYHKVFELTLYAVTRCNNIENFGEQMLGSVYDVDSFIDSNYNLVNTLFGKMVESSRRNAFVKFKKVLLKEMPDEIKIEDLRAEKGHSRVRKID